MTRRTDSAAFSCTCPMYARTTSSPKWPTMRCSSSMPLEFAAIWARRSARLVAGSRDGYSADSSSLTVSASRSRAAETSSQLSISTPSSSTRVLLAGMEPGDTPPISAWCPRLAT